MASSFVDKARISIHAGKGGDGAVAFHREKYVAAGGPDGGDGGRGGNIVFTVDENMSTLMDFRYKRKYTAGNGANGSGKRCYGKDGETLYIKVPRGTLVRDTATNAIIHDMSTGEDWVAAKGGRLCRGPVEAERRGCGRKAAWHQRAVSGHGDCLGGRGRKTPVDGQIAGHGEVVSVKVQRRALGNRQLRDGDRR